MVCEANLALASDTRASRAGKEVVNVGLGGWFRRAFRDREAVADGASETWGDLSLVSTPQTGARSGKWGTRGGQDSGGGGEGQPRRRSECRFVATSEDFRLGT